MPSYDVPRVTGERVNKARPAAASIDQTIKQGENNMNLITRSDFDGLACGALLYEAGIIDTFTFKHPKDIQDGLVPVTENDVLANVPFVEGCGLWFVGIRASGACRQVQGREPHHSELRKNNL